MHGPGHYAFNEARQKHEGITPGVEFITMQDAVDGYGSPVRQVGDGQALTKRARANRKALPARKVRDNFEGGFVVQYSVK